MIDLSCGVRMFAQVSLVLSQCTHLTDRETDRPKGLGSTVRCDTCNRTVKIIYNIYKQLVTKLKHRGNNPK